MTLLEFINLDDPSHVVAIAHRMRTGKWPDDFFVKLKVSEVQEAPIEIIALIDMIAWRWLHENMAEFLTLDMSGDQSG